MIKLSVCEGHAGVWSKITAYSSCLLTKPTVVLGEVVLFLHAKRDGGQGVGGLEQGLQLVQLSHLFLCKDRGKGLHI
jgi:hypothetical protein